jgi:hypothetical protein
MWAAQVTSQNTPISPRYRDFYLYSLVTRFFLEDLMKNNSRLVILFVLIFSMLVAACGPATPTASPTEVTEPSVTYPEPEAAYPAPAVSAPAANPYPGPSEGVTNYASWSQAESALMGGLVSQVFEAATLHVTLVMKDGSIMLALEPSSGEVSRVIETCGDACKGVEMINP